MSAVAHLRTIAAGVSALTLCSGLVTQMIARTLGYAAALGPPLLDLRSLRLYPPFSFLSWTFAWAPIAPSLFVFALFVLCVCALAAYATAILVAGLQPISFPNRSPWRDLASWRDLSDWGLLRDKGLALGAARRHRLAAHQIVRHPGQHCLFLGATQNTDDALCAALAHWRGPLVVIDGRCAILERLNRSDVLRFAPGHPDTLGFNPLLAVRGDLHAWADARHLASALLDCEDDDTLNAFALLMLDQLLCAPGEHRNLGALRRRLVDRTSLVAELCGRWCELPKTETAPAATWEMVRAARALRTMPDLAIAHYGRIDDACAMFADAGIAAATSRHQIDLGAFLSGEAPKTLAISTAGLTAPYGAPLVQGVLAQLVARCAIANDGPPLLIAIEADAAHQFAMHGAPTLAIAPSMRVVVQTEDIATARTIAADATFNAITAIGPQTSASAEALTKASGQTWTYEQCPVAIPRWRRNLFPTWIKREVERLPAMALQAAAAHQALLLSANRKPALLRVLVGGGAPNFVDPATIENAAHDWTAIPTQPPPPSPEPKATLAPITPAAKLRRALTRAPAPKPSDKQGKIL